MQYGRTLFELLLAQVVTLTALLVVPADLITSVSPLLASSLAAAYAASLAYLLYARHRGRNGIRRASAAVQEGREMARRLVTSS